ncbi:MAG TPA: protein kinase [Kofleriaceae bacterium]|nr:protein kinase [Kofleriaceae bacterium]
MRPELDDTQAAPAERTAAERPAALDRTATQAPRATPSSAELPAGLRLGHFRIDSKLGAGGMGEVYLATDLALDRPVAVKVLPSDAASGSARERLIKEARAQARVHHPNVAHIYFIGEEDGRLYFAMEYLTGKTLADRIAAGPLPVEDALALIRAAALGLREAQRAGFTHRDVKPSNLMVDGHGVLKVLDFGLAAGTPDRASDGPIAQTTLAGTPLYMAPEQARGEAIDFRADIYALGATLYHLVSGKPPFMADSVDQLITLHATAARPSVPRGANPRTMIAAIDALVARMMAPDAKDRFASYDELLRAIELASVELTRPAGFWVRSVASAVDLILVAILLGIVAVGRELVGLGSGDIEMGRYGFGIAALYGTLAIGRWGTTAGKALLELEVVSAATTRRPSWPQALRRELAITVAPWALSWADFINHATGSPLPGDLFDILSVASLGVLVLMLLHAALRVPGKRAPWDRLAGTMVRYRTSRGSAGAPG